MKKLFFSSLFFILLSQNTDAQSVTPIINVRLSFLLLPFTPLLSVETKVFGKLTLQGETNFVNTHGVNVKYFPKEIMQEHYWFIGTAFLENKTLRQDLKLTTLPYAGIGYAYGLQRNWLVDGRFGIGRTINADKNFIYPVAKIGIGRKF